MNSNQKKIINLMLNFLTWKSLGSGIGTLETNSQASGPMNTQKLKKK